MKPIFILNGPNLNLVGQREPEIYGAATLADIEAETKAAAEKLGLAAEFRQTNHEGALVDWLQEAKDAACAVILNAGAYSHTSIAILDALRALSIPVVEVHLSNIFRREPFRHHSYVALGATGVICGFGARGYLLAVQAVSLILTPSAPSARSSDV